MRGNARPRTLGWRYSVRCKERTVLVQQARILRVHFRPVCAFQSTANGKSIPGCFRHGHGWNLEHVDKFGNACIVAHDNGRNITRTRLIWCPAKSRNAIPASDRINTEIQCPQIERFTSATSFLPRPARLELTFVLCHENAPTTKGTNANARPFLTSRHQYS